MSAVEVDTGQTHSIKTNTVGYYFFPYLAPGTYRVEVEKTGFKKFIRGAVKIDVGLAATINISLQLGATSQAVTVTSTAPLLESRASSLGHVVTNDQIVELPINGRNSYGFASLVPGVFAPPGFGQVAYDMYNDQFVSINGARPNQNVFLMDGGTNTEPGFNGPGIFPPLDAVREYKVQTNNYSAEFSNAAGGVVNLITKSGTNQFHGDLYEFLRNNALDANDFFLNRSGRSTPPYRFNQFGGTVGGPVIIPGLYNGKNKTFFFASYEGLRWNTSLVATGTMPTVAQRNGDFSNTYNSKGQLVTIYNPFTVQPDPSNPGSYIRTPFSGNVIQPQAMIDPVAANMVKWLPLPNTAGNPLTGTNNFVEDASSTISKNTGLIRIDQNIGPNQRLFFRGIMNNTVQPRPALYGTKLYPATPTNGNDELDQRSVALDYTRSMSSSTVMELNSSFVRYIIYRNAPGYNFDPVQLGFPSYLDQLPLAPCFPSIGITGLGISVNVPNNGGGLMGGCGHLKNAFQNFHNVANFTKVQGKHTLQFGGDFGISSLAFANFGSASSGFGFSPAMTQGPDPLVASSNAGVAFASFLLGTGSSGSIASSGAPIDILYRYYGLYLQDQWKATSKLTVNLGLRYDYYSPWTERHNRLTNFNFTDPSPLQVPGLNLVGGLEFPGANGLPRGHFNSDKDNFQPRFGLAYALNHNTVLRGGFGLFTASINGGAVNDDSLPISGWRSSTSYVGSLDGIHPLDLLSNPFPNGFVYSTGTSLGLATLAGQGVVGMDRNRQNPYGMDWNVGIERNLPGSFVLSLAYAGSRGIHLFGDINYNQLPDQYLSMGTALNQLVANPFYGIISVGSLSNPTVVASQLLRPYPQFTGVTAGNSSFGASTYHALQVNLQRRFAKGLSMQASYTYSKLMDDVRGSTAGGGFPGGQFSGFAGQDAYNRRNDWAPAQFDVTHNFVFNGIWQLPFGPKKRYLNNERVLGAVLGGWQLGGILTFQTGVPLRLGTAQNTMHNYGGQLASWDGTDPYVSGPISNRLNNYFNASAFSVPAPFTYGNLARTLSWLRGPGVANLDASLDKNIPITERVKMQFRFEVFNAMNRPRFGLPNTAIGSVNAGVISNQQNTPRELQFALKLRF